MVEQTVEHSTRKPFMLDGMKTNEMSFNIRNEPLHSGAWYITLGADAINGFLDERPRISSTDWVVKIQYKGRLHNQVNRSRDAVRQIKQLTVHHSVTTVHGVAMMHYNNMRLYSSGPSFQLIEVSFTFDMRREIQTSLQQISSPLRINSTLTELVNIIR